LEGTFRPELGQHDIGSTSVGSSADFEIAGAQLEEEKERLVTKENFPYP
jgi:hypothetical protein